ncbi:cyclin-A2 [Eurytemora carolleeae]|uniref:cyclin-A2 n=1 Tax=Eurytemora carolleeae TaxID=1294199 RepID=UPI000C7560FA|nr:cyclin-A2 [Eurytemora carolleeae]XP_023330451.1 cyclin-A2 [Eurytemora carolleeae]|eukprot:XP_023330450.1 cyclin-A2-like [Eurytemora affinis]
METKLLLDCTKRMPEQDESWLPAGWLNNTCLSKQSRSGVVDWLIQVQQYLGLADTCLHAAVATMDLALYTVDWDPEEVQLLALASLQLAAKMEEDTPPGPALFLPLAGDIYAKEDLARIEMELLQALNWKIRQTTASVFLHFYSDLCGKGLKPLFRMARAILDLCLLQDWYGCEKPSTLASACLAAAGCVLGQPWSEEMTQVTGFTQTELAPTLRLTLSAALEDQGDGFVEKSGKVGRNICKLKNGIQGLVHGLDQGARDTRAG